eukprot:scaffold306_cov67-Cylindrotheca_fusiformis.AAC.2
MTSLARRFADRHLCLEQSYAFLGHHFRLLNSNITNSKHHQTDDETEQKQTTQTVVLGLINQIDLMVITRFGKERLELQRIGFDRSVV